MVHARTLLLSALCAMACPALAVAQPRPAVRTESRGPLPPDEIAGEGATGSTLTRHRIDTTVSTQVGGGCTYEVIAQGSYRAAPPRSPRESSEVRDADIRASALLVCNGNVVRSESQRLVFPETTSRALMEEVRARLTLVAAGGHCAYAPVVSFDNAHLEARNVRSSCGVRHPEIAAGGGASAPVARGGGPRR